MAHHRRHVIKCPPAQAHCSRCVRWTLWKNSSDRQDERKINKNALFVSNQKRGILCDRPRYQRGIATPCEIDNRSSHLPQFVFSSARGTTIQLNGTATEHPLVIIAAKRRNTMPSRGPRFSGVSPPLHRAFLLGSRRWWCNTTNVN